MKIHEYIGFIVSCWALVRIVNEILTLVEFQSASLLTSGIISFMMILAFFVYQLQRDNIKIKNVLKEKGLLKEGESGGFMANIIGKRGYVDARVLWILMAILLIYLMWKAGKLPF